MSNEGEMQSIIREFKEISGFPQAVGAIDCCHIRIKAPLKDAEDHIDKKDYHSIVLQGLADNNYIFHDVCCSSLLLLMAVCCSLRNVCELKKEEFFED